MSLLRGTNYSRCPSLFDVESFSPLFLFFFCCSQIGDVFGFAESKGKKKEREIPVLLSLEVVILSLTVIMVFVFVSFLLARRVLFSLFLSFSSGGTGSGFVFLLLPLAGFFLGSHGAQLEGVDAVLLGHLIAEKGVDHAVTGRLHLGVESVRGDDHAVTC